MDEVIAVDTNILVHAHRECSPFHQSAEKLLINLAEGNKRWAIPWPCLHEFFSIVTHPKIFSPPTPFEFAVMQIEFWMESPSLILLRESDSYWFRLQRLIKESKISGPLIHDARIAALCLDYGVETLLTADRDFSRFTALETQNPLIGS